MTDPNVPAANRPFRVGLIGYGYSGKTFHAPYIKATPGLELILAASSDAAKVHRDFQAVEVRPDAMAVATDSKVDVVVIASPNASHAPLARAALLAGKHVIVDKPFTVTLDEARELVRLAAENECVLSVFHNRRWDSDFLSVRSAISTDRVGAIRHFESRLERFRPEVRARWREQDHPGSGIWFDIGPHLIDQALQLFGLPLSVQARLFRQRRRAVVDDAAHAVLEYPHGLAVFIHMSMLAAGPAPRFIVHGERGTLIKAHADRQEAQLLQGAQPRIPGWGQDPDPLQIHDEACKRADEPALDGDQTMFYQGFLKALQRVEDNPVPPGDALAVMAILEAGVVADQRKSSQPVALTPEEHHEWTTKPAFKR